MLIQKCCNEELSFACRWKDAYHLYVCDQCGKIWKENLLDHKGWTTLTTDGKLKTIVPLPSALFDSRSRGSFEEPDPFETDDPDDQ